MKANIKQSDFCILGKGQPKKKKIGTIETNYLEP